MPSIQPKQRASRTLSSHVRLGLPVLFLWKPTQSSCSVAWCDESQVRKEAGVGKNRGSARSSWSASLFALSRRFLGTGMVENRLQNHGLERASERDANGLLLGAHMSGNLVFPCMSADSAMIRSRQDERDEQDGGRSLTL